VFVNKDSLNMMTINATNVQVAARNVKTKINVQTVHLYLIDFSVIANVFVRVDILIMERKNAKNALLAVQNVLHLIIVQAVRKTFIKN
jgi:hypothetical protein